MNLKLNFFYAIFIVETYSWGEIPTTSLKQVKNGTIETNTIEAIGANAGFGRRSSFFSVFKKQMGCTPLEYIKQKI